MAMVMTTKSGRWSDPTVWSSGTVPGAGDMAHIMSGHEIVYDAERDVILSDVMSEMGSRLTWDAAKETRLRVNTMMLKGILDMTDKGISATPGKPKHEVVFHPISGKAPGAGTGLGIMCMGPVRIHGAPKAGYLRSADMAIAAGAQTVTLTDLGKSGWRVGDTVIVVGTEYVPIASSDPQYTGPKSYYGRGFSGVAQYTLNRYQFGQDEERIITAISGDTITLDRALDYQHAGLSRTLKNGKVITVVPVVGNVSRSIRFRSATAAEDGALDPGADVSVLQKRAHLMLMRCNDVDARYFETKNMGRTSTDPSLTVDDLPYNVELSGGIVSVPPILAAAGGAPLADPNNVRGRYSIHLHWSGGPYRNAKMVPLIGATAWAPIGGPPIPGWAITQHATHAAIEDCVVSNVRGAGMVSELGNEQGQWAFNLVTGCRGDGGSEDIASRSELYTNHNGASGIAFENQSRAIKMHGNIAGSSTFGYLWHAQKSNKWLRVPRAVDLPFCDGLSNGAAFTTEYWADDDMISIVKPQIPPFIDNAAFACETGFSVIHRGITVNHSADDRTPMLIEGLICLNTKFGFDVPQYSNTYYCRDFLFKGPDNVKARSAGIVIGNISWGWNFANGIIDNFGTAVRDAGAGLNYEGNFIDILWPNCTAFTNAPYVTATGIQSLAIKNVMGDWEDHPTDTTKAIIRRYKSIDSATDLPTPYPLAPYGRKLPTDRPDGTPYPIVKPGDTPYFVLGDGTNGAASTDPAAIKLTLAAGSGRDQGVVYGIIRDSVGDRRWPDWQSSESFPAQTSIKTYRSLGRLTPEQLVQRWGCWNDNGTWKVRVWFYDADRFTHVKFNFYIDFTLTRFDEKFLASYAKSDPATAPIWPDRLEAVPAQPPLQQSARSLAFLSRTRLECASGVALSHRLRPNAILTKLEVAGGPDAAQFAISNQVLKWAGAAKTLNAGDANGDNVYEVTVRASDHWGNVVEQPHQVVVVNSERVSSVISDTFDRADENLEANPAYLRIGGTAGAAAIVSNKLSIVANTAGPTVYDLGSLGTSEQQVSVNFTAFNTSAYILMRMVDENNWIGFRRNDAAAAIEIFTCIGGVVTRICRYASWSDVTLRLQGRLMVMVKNGNTSNQPVTQYPQYFDSGVALLGPDARLTPGAVVLPENAPMGTKIGLRVGTTATSGWIDNFSARALES